MGKSLILAEKPSVGKDIARVMNCRAGGQGYMENDKYIVTWAMGHLVTLADPEAYDKRYEKWDLNDLPILPDKLELTVIGKTAKQYNTVKGLLHRKDVAQVIIATDAGREGELVARWILEKAKVRKPLKRLWISSVTDRAIREGFQKLRDGKAYENLYRSAEARAEADWLLGINATRALTTKHNAQLSCGRVQTPTLSIIARREDEIRRFVPKDYYGISAKVKGVSFIWHGAHGSSTFDQNVCDEITKRISGKKAEVVELTKERKRSSPPLLYDLTRLQADANKMFGFSAKETLSAMQGLYETHKVLTYPRTDSRYLTSDIADTLGERVKACAVGPYKRFCAKLAGAKYSKNAYFFNDQKVSDHHAIIPTEQPAVLDLLNERERRIYDLVVKRFLSALYPPFEYEQTDVTVKIDGELFKAKGKRVLALGYREIGVGEEEGDEDGGNTLPEFAKGELLTVEALAKTSGKTKPPAPFNEATLLGAMENPASYMETDNKELIKTIGETGGLGTVATRADIIEKLFNSFVIEKKGKDIFITPKGRQLLALVPKDFASPLLTARWEQRLARISEGREDYTVFLREIRGAAHEVIGQIKSVDAKFVHDNLTGERCPECGKFLLDVNGKKGRMLVCQDRECGYRKSVSIITNARCPQCHKRLELIGEGEKKKFICACGYREKYSTFQERRQKESSAMNKRDVENFMKKQGREEPKNNALADALAGFKFTE